MRYERIQQTAKTVPRSGDNDVDASCLEGSSGGNWLALVPDLCSGGTGWLRRDSMRHVMQMAGTTPYMAPEVFAGWYDHRFDNFSIGIILYELLYSSHPFYTPLVDDQCSVKARIISADPEFASGNLSDPSFAAINRFLTTSNGDPQQTAMKPAIKPEHK